MAGLATRINPADLPGVWDGWAGVLGVLQLVLAGIVMTTVMQSSSVAVAATLSALYAGAISRVMWPLPEHLPTAERRFPRPDSHFAAYMNN